MPRTHAQSLLQTSVLLGFALGLWNCPSPTPQGDAGRDGGGDAGPPPNWAEHVAPIVYEHCVSCHQPGGIGQFSLTTYEQAAPMAGLLALKTRAREMPPMPVDNSGVCNTYSNARWLSDAELVTFERWASTGALRGDPARDPVLPGPAPGLPRTDLTLQPGFDYTPSVSDADDYHCFVLDPGLTTAKFVTGWEFVPGDPREVHHAIVYALGTDAAQTAVEALDLNGRGYTCYGGAGVNDASPAMIWAPGGGATVLPAGTGLPLARARKVVLQIHYNTAGGAFPERSTVRFMTENAVAKPAAMVALLNGNLNLPAGQMNVRASATQTMNTGPVTVHGVLPHMHGYGRSLEVTARSGSTDTCLVNVDRWNFHWQGAWFYTQPLSFPAVSSVTITCNYDTTTAQSTIHWGENTTDEMCLTYVYVSAGP